MTIALVPPSGRPKSEVHTNEKKPPDINTERRIVNKIKQWPALHREVPVSSEIGENDPVLNN